MTERPPSVVAIEQQVTDGWLCAELGGCCTELIFGEVASLQIGRTTADFQLLRWVRSDAHAAAACTALDTRSGTINEFHMLVRSTPGAGIGLCLGSGRGQNLLWLAPRPARAPSGIAWDRLSAAASPWPLALSCAGEEIELDPRAGYGADEGTGAPTSATLGVVVEHEHARIRPGQGTPCCHLERLVDGRWRASLPALAAERERGPALPRALLPGTELALGGLWLRVGLAEWFRSAWMRRLMSLDEDATRTFPSKTPVVRSLRGEIVKPAWTLE